jgi:hypothetical protein
MTRMRIGRKQRDLLQKGTQAWRAEQSANARCRDVGNEPLG